MNAPQRFAVLTVLFALAALSASAQRADDTASWQPLIDAAHDVLAGRPIAEAGIRLSPDAYVVCNGVYAHLASVAAAQPDSLAFREDSARVDASLAMKINDAKDAAYLTLKTKAARGGQERFHTVVYMKDAQAQWVIEAWHASR
jgi:hypothetical protein